MIAIHRSFARHGLVRDTQDNLLGGVCSGLARRFGVDAWAVRILVVASLLVIPGSQIIIYPILWVLMPDEARAQAAFTGCQQPAGGIRQPDVRQRGTGIRCRRQPGQPAAVHPGRER